MKKIFLALSAAALLGAASSCSNSGSTNASDADKAYGDSIATALGEFAGAQSAAGFDRMKDMRPEMAAKFKKDSYIRGLKAVLDADTADIAYLQGLQMGMQLAQPINGITNEYGIPVSKEAVLKAFKAVYEADSVGDMSTYYSKYEELMGQLMARVQARKDAELSESAEAKENLKAGADYIEKMKGEGYTVTESGLAYKIEKAGDAETVKPTDIVMMQYEGRHVNGEVFDSNKDHVTPMRANGFVPGFNEALQKLGKGGKMTAVIPADLAYGLHGQGDKIGPNETLVFDIQVLDVNPK